MDWKDADSADFVLRWAENSHVDAVAESVKASAEEAGRRAKEAYWDEANDNGIGFDQNPYRRERENNVRRIDEANEKVVRWRGVLDFLRKRICNLIENK
jgi:hypothetical protein